MKTFTRMLCVLLCGLGLQVFADNPKGLDKKGKTPAGFSKGKKKGWKNNYPPGWDKKSAKDKADWKADVENNRQAIKKACKDKGLTDAETETVCDGFERGARVGLDMTEHAKDINGFVKAGKRGKDLATAIDNHLEKKTKPAKTKPAKGKQGKGKK